jgi:putative acyl-CoA dehydrogenase
MSQAPFSTHEVFNQSPPFEDVDLYGLDRPLIEAVAANNGAYAQQELSEFGKRWGSSAMAERGRIANESTPKLRTFDSRGNRRDEVEFHPAYHERAVHMPACIIRPGARPETQPAARPR